MVNLGLNLSSLLGILLAVAGAGLYFLRTWRPKLARDHDIFFAAVGLLCGGILLFQGWRLDPILAFGQFLLSGTAIFFAAESISLRGAATQQARSRTPIVDEDRPVSQSYSYVEAELDELEPVEEYPANRRIRGYQDGRSPRGEAYEEENRRRPPSRSSSYDRQDVSQERPRKRRPRPETPPRSSERDWDFSTDPEPRRRTSRSREDWDVPKDVEERSRRPRSQDDGQDLGDRDDRYRGTRKGETRRDTSVNAYPETRPSRAKRQRPPEESGSRNASETKGTPTDYVEYRPVESPEEEVDNSENLDAV